MTTGTKQTEEIKRVFKEASTCLKRFSESITKMSAHIVAKESRKHHENTKMYMVLPLLAGLGYDATNPDHCDWEACGLPEGTRRRNGGMSSDARIFSTTGTTILVEVKSIALGYSQLQESWVQLAKCAVEHGSRFGIMTNGRLLLVFCFDEWAKRTHGEIEPFWTIDLLHASRKNFVTLTHLHRDVFSDRYWAAIQEKNYHRRRNKRNPLLGATMPVDDLDPLNSVIGEGGKSAFLSNALRIYGPHIEKFLPEFRQFRTRISPPCEVTKAAIRTKTGQDEDLIKMRDELPTLVRDLLGSTIAPGFCALVGFCAHLKLMNAGIR